MKRRSRYRRPAIRASGADANTDEMVKAYEDLGCSVKVLTAVGGGVSDLLIGFLGVNHLREVKRALVPGSVPPSAAKLRKSQEDFARDWRGEKPEVVRVKAQVRADVDVWCLRYWSDHQGSTLASLSPQEQATVAAWRAWCVPNVETAIANWKADRARRNGGGA